MPGLPASLAERFARLALANITTEFPHHLIHLMQGPDDLASPRTLHPAFYGSYDWHSSVHMHWLLIRLLRLYDRLPAAAGAIATLEAHLSAASLERELAYLRERGRQSFERPYGWAWLLKLAVEVDAAVTVMPQARRWQAALAPLAREIAARFAMHLAQATYPVRAGTHGNSAFAMRLALDFADVAGDRRLAATIRERAGVWFSHDRDYPARYEPSGDDFLSGGLVEAVLMQRVLGPVAFSVWWREFCPKGEDRAFWLQPAHVVDRADPKFAHLDGLNLSRAWCLRTLVPVLEGPQRAAYEGAIERHLEASLPYAVQGDYAGTHWLASFATLALTE